MPRSKDQLAPRDWGLPRTVLVAAIAFVAYVGSIPSGFVFDDRPVLGSAVIRGTAPLYQVFLRDWWGYIPPRTIGSYRPLAALALWLDWRIGGWFKALTSGWWSAPFIAAHGGDPRAWPMHLANVLLHAAAMALVYRVLRTLASEGAAFGAALICAVVAAPAEVVQGLVGRADLLETIGLIGGLWAHRRVGARWGAAATGALLLALGSKETGAMALIAWPAFDVILPNPEQPWRQRLGRYAGYAGAAVAYLVARRAGIGTLHLPRTSNALYNPLLVAGTSERVFGAGRIFLERYVLGMIDPRRRLYDCSSHACGVSDAHDVMAWGGLLLFAILLALPLILRRRAPVVAAGLTWFVIFFAPVSNFFFPATLTYGERLLYVPMIGLALAIAETLRLLTRCARWVWAPVAIVLAMNVLFLQERHLDWRSDAALSASGLRYAADSVVVQENNATSAVDRRDYVAAEDFSRRAIELWPTDGYAHKALGVTFFHEGRLAEAETELRRAVELERQDDIVADFANFLAMQKRYREAIDLVRRQLRSDPADDTLLDLQRRLERALRR